MISDFLKDLFFPRRCPVCDRPVKPFGRLICSDCRSEIRFVGGTVCMKCGSPLKDEQEYCDACKGSVHAYDSGLGVFEYRTVARSIYRLKYGGRREYADYFGTVMALRIRKLLPVWKPDGIVPVPLSAGRMRKRGFNQAGLLAEAMGRELSLPVYTDLVGRILDTVPQKELNANERQNNLKKAFKILNYDVKLETVIIVDDIYTTGATIDAMAAVLKNAGVGHVYFVALSIGVSV